MSFPRSYLISAMIGYLILFGGILYAISGKADTATLHTAQVGTCQQLTVLQAQANLYGYQAFIARVQGAERERRLQRLARSPEAIRAHAKSANELESQASDVSVAGLIDCKASVHSRDYVFPVNEPMGNPISGRLTPQVKLILKKSQTLVTTHPHQSG